MTETPAGWYPDPEVPGQLRWWDGSAWTSNIHRAEPAGSGPLPGAPLMEVTSHDRDKKNATVRIYTDRLELARIGISSSAKFAVAYVTMGASLLSKRGRGGQQIQNEILFLHPQTAIKTDSDGFGWTIVTVQTPSGSMSFRITRAEADRAKVLIADLARQATVGVTPMVQFVAAPVSPQASAPSPPTGATMVEQLAGLGELHKTGVLSDEEFGAAKARLLGGQ